MPMPTRYTRLATCNECGHSGTIHEIDIHDCNHEAQVQEFGGRCEDYPCCGHTDGDGCSVRQEHTKEYWIERMMDDDNGYDYDYDMEY